MGGFAYCLECAAPCASWRSCGAGCSLVVAFCVEHGGDWAASDAMAEHVAEMHALDDDRRPDGAE